MVEKLTLKQKQEVKKEVEKEVREVEKKVEKEVGKKVEEEIEKRLHEKVYGKAVRGASKFKDEFKKHTFTAIAAAFAFLIALSWRTPIQNSINALIEKLGLAGNKAIYVEYGSAVVITIIAVVALIFLSRWSSEKK